MHPLASPRLPASGHPFARGARAVLLALSSVVLFAACSGRMATRGSARCPAWDLSCREPVVNVAPDSEDRAAPTVLWVGAGGQGALAGGLRAGGVRVVSEPASAPRDRIARALRGRLPIALVLDRGGLSDSLAREWAGAAAWMDRREAPAVFLWVTDPVDSAGRAALYGGLAARDSSESVARILWNYLDTARSASSMRLEATASLVDLPAFGRPLPPSSWGVAGVVWDSTRYRRLSEAPVERLIPLAASPDRRAEEVATSLRGRLPLPPPLDPRRRLRILLDVGHMPRNDSAPIKGQGMVSAHGQDEFELNRKAALALAAALRDSLGAEVIVHNEDGTERALRTRTRAARLADADLFLAIHHDAVQLSQTSTWTWQGVERLYCDSIGGFSLFMHDSSVNFPQALGLARSIGRTLREGGRTPNLHHARRTPDSPGRELLDSAGGVYRADFAVLLSARMPAILVECGMALNRQEELVLDSDAGRAEFARLVASGAKRWLAAGAPADPRAAPAVRR